MSLKVEDNARYLKLLKHLKKQITCRGIFRSVRVLTAFDPNKVWESVRELCVCLLHNAFDGQA